MKKTLSLLIALVMVLSCFAFASTASAEERVMGGTVTGAMNVDVNTYASWRIRSQQEKTALSPVYETLMRFDAEGNLQPYLAESLTADQANLTYTVKLRDGITFSDGSKLDGDALLWNFENFKENSQTSATHFGSVDHFEKTDDLTVVIHLKEWNTQIPFSLNSVAGLMYSKKAFDENGYDWCLEHAVGTGPYVMTEYISDDHKTYEKNPTYWNAEAEPATFDKITLKIIADTMSAQAALLSKEIDFYLGSDNQMKDTLQSMGYNLYHNKMWYTIYFLIFGSAVEGSPLADVKVRQAIAYAIDSDAISKNLDYGMSFVSNQYAVEGTPFYSSEVKGYEYNVEKAKQLLAEAGYPDGFSTKISVGVDQRLDRYMVALQGYLQKVGITVELDYQETAIWTSKGIYETDEGMILAGHGFGANLVNQAVNNFSKRAVSGVGMLKNSKLHPDDLDAALMAALSAADNDIMLENMHEAERLIIDEYCLGYPVVMGYGGEIITQPDIIDSGFFADFNEMHTWTNLYRVK
jgi:ABC-type transport system substrate-binding protein